MLLYAKPPVAAAIAFDHAADLSYAIGGSGLTASYTVGSGSNRILFVGIVGPLTSDPNNINSVKYAGTDMTSAISRNMPGLRWGQVWYLLNPATGPNNVVVTFNIALNLFVGAASYSGAKQSAQPDATIGTDSGVSAVSSITQAITTVADKSWVLAFTVASQNQNLGGNGGAGQTVRASDATYGLWALGDSAAALTPAGSKSITSNQPGGAIGALGLLLVSFAPG
jgi:hypothetical protein